MSSPLENQAKVWVQTLSSQQTLSAYQAVLESLLATLRALWEALKVTWDILKETGKLLWLVLCLGLVAFDWIWDGGSQLVSKTKAITKQASNPSSEHYFADASKALLEASKSSAVKAVAQAREQLGLPQQDRPARPDPQPGSAAVAVDRVKSVKSSAAPEPAADPQEAKADSTKDSATSPEAADA
ncbi:hypothetical protein [Lyngbya confervoides]|uniref:Uncharacterized protein n=1 Tax=Lyngbya confervoides BDU141951 TaxID=1574623 RepID=A0ABD4T5S0_9CYAN|nr:hypothetical protein [Lyngbya confervoides]MCM1983939.1 hypothetical protein [Lyngbya confervoides BDU141951]